MSGKIDQNVDAICRDFLRQGRVRKTGNAVPVLEMTTQARRNAPLSGVIVIGVQVTNLDSLPDAPAAARESRPPDGRADHRKQTQSANTLRVAIIAVLRPTRAQRRFKLLAKATVFGKQRLRTDRFLVTEAEQQVGMRLGEIRFELQRPAITRYRIIKLPEAQQGIAQVAMRLGVIGFDLQRLAIARQCPVESPGVSQCFAEVIMCASAKSGLISSARR